MAPNWVPHGPMDDVATHSRSDASSELFFFDDSSRGNPRSTRSVSSSALSIEPELSMGSVGSAQRRTTFTDQQLREMAGSARSSVNWDTLERELVYTDSGVWKSRRKAAVSNGMGGATAVSTLEVDGTFAVAAVSNIPCSVAELRLVFRTRSKEQYDSVMKSVYAGGFLDGDLVHTVPQPAQLKRPTNRRFTSTSSVGSTVSMSTTSTTPSATPSAANAAAEPAEEISIKTLRFDKSSFLATHEDWCFLESVHSIEPSPSLPPTPSLGRTLVSLPFSSCKVSSSHDKKTLRKAKQGERVIINYCFREDPSGRSTRVLFHGEYISLSSKKSFRPNSWRFIKNRLIYMAEQSSRYMLVARRRRLGMQVLIDPSRVATSNANCVCCSRSFLLSKKRLCFLCGFLVCDRCSRMQEREFFPRGQPRTRTQIDDVRLCVRCLIRVDHCKFNTITEDDMYPASVIPDFPLESPSFKPLPESQPLSELLEQSLVNANTVRKESAKSVMRYLAEIERESRKSSFVPATLSSSSEVATPGSTRSNSNAATSELLQKIGFTGPLDNGLPLEECELGNADARNYPMEFPEDPTVVVPVPRGPDEQKRVETITKNKLDELGEVPELDIICSIATKELDCSVSMVTLVESEKMRVLASTAPGYGLQAFPRDQGFCSHTIMTDKPLMVPNVQADVRFSAMPVVQQMDLNFYCGFPLVAADNTVIGSVCCVDQRPHRLTRSQYATMKNLAETASKVVQREAAKRKMSNASL